MAGGSRKARARSQSMQGAREWHRAMVRQLLELSSEFGSCERHPLVLNPRQR